MSVSLINGHIDDDVMTDEQIIKSADNKVVKQRVKAIYPHITVSGAVDKPYYNIDWYDIEKNTMYRGFSSYNLELVRKWLEEEFEVVEADIDDLINRQQAEIKRLERIKETIAILAIKEFAKRLKKNSNGYDELGDENYFEYVTIDEINNIEKEMAGAESAEQH